MSEELSSTYVEEELALGAVLGLLFQEDITNRVHNEHLAVLSDDALLRSLRPRSKLSLDRSADASGARSSYGLDLLALLSGVLVHGAFLATVPGDKLLLSGILLLGLVFPLLSVHRLDAGDTLDGALVTPGSLTRMADVALNELPATPPAHEQRKVVHASTKDGEASEQHREEARTKAVVVVATAPPSWETIPHKVVVSLAFGALEELGNDRETLVALSDLLHVRIDFLLRWPLGALLARLLLGRLPFFDEDLAGLVGMKSCRLLAVRLVQFVLRCAGLDAEDVVEGDIVAL